MLRIEFMPDADGELRKMLHEGTRISIVKGSRKQTAPNACELVVEMVGMVPGLGPSKWKIRARATTTVDSTNAFQVEVEAPFVPGAGAGSVPAAMSGAIRDHVAWWLVGEEEAFLLKMNRMPAPPRWLPSFHRCPHCSSVVQVLARQQAANEAGSIEIDCGACGKKISVSASFDPSGTSATVTVSPANAYRN